MCTSYVVISSLSCFLKYVHIWYGEVPNMFIAITAALSTVVPAEIARLILAAAVGYTIANRMSGSADDDDDEDEEDTDMSFDGGFKL